LILISKMNDVSVYVTFDKSSCRLARGIMVLAKGTQCGTLFKLETSTYCNSINITENSNSCMW